MQDIFILLSYEDEEAHQPVLSSKGLIIAGVEMHGKEKLERSRHGQNRTNGYEMLTANFKSKIRQVDQNFKALKRPPHEEQNLRQIWHPSSHSQDR